MTIIAIIANILFPINLKDCWASIMNAIVQAARAILVRPPGNYFDIEPYAHYLDDFS